MGKFSISKMFWKGKHVKIYKSVSETEHLTEFKFDSYISI